MRIRLAERFDHITAAAQPYQKGLAVGVAAAVVLGLIMFGGAWALVIALVAFMAGGMSGLVVGMVIADADNATRITALEANYEAASGLAYKLNQEVQGLAQRAESAESALLASAAEKTTLRAQLDAIQADGTA